MFLVFFSIETCSPLLLLNVCCLAVTCYSKKKKRKKNEEERKSIVHNKLTEFWWNCFQMIRNQHRHSNNRNVAHLRVGCHHRSCWRSLRCRLSDKNWHLIHHPYPWLVSALIRVLWTGDVNQLVSLPSYFLKVFLQIGFHDSPCCQIPHSKTALDHETIAEVFVVLWRNWLRLHSE